MESLEPTFGRSFKVWWSFVWRGFVLMLGIVLPIEMVLFAFVMPSIPVHQKGAPPDPAQFMHLALIMLVAWPVMMAAMICANVLAMRWMLRKARWSDFHLALLRPE